VTVVGVSNRERLLVRFRASCDLGICFGKDADDASCDFVVDDRLVVFSYDVDSEFLLKRVGIF
jgi:hypothetical protein